jgi:hypothetical protein
MSWTWVTKHGMYSATKQVVDNRHLMLTLQSKANYLVTKLYVKLNT